MAVVYRAVDPVADRPLAVKVLRLPNPATEDETSEARLRFETEVQTLSRLSPHENIPTFYHYHGGGGGEYTYFAMELVQGESLDKKIAVGGARRPEEVVPIIRQISTVLDYAHRKGIVHRDIKPGNVLLRPDGVVKIIDFGIARVGSQNLTATGVRLGTPAYMAPEQIRGEDVGGPADQFSLAVLAYRLLTGRMPFEGQDELVVYNILHSEPPPPSRLNPALPPELDGVLQRALKKGQNDRFTTCVEFAAALDSALFNPRGPSSADAARWIPAHHSGSSYNKAALAGLVCLVVASLAIWAMIEKERRTVATPASASSAVGGAPTIQPPPVRGGRKLNKPKIPLPARNTTHFEGYPSGKTSAPAILQPRPPSSNTVSATGRQGGHAPSVDVSHLDLEYRPVVQDWFQRNPEFRGPAVMSDCSWCKGGRLPVDWSSDNKHPYYAAGDFNKDSQTDVAVVSKRGDLVIFNGPLRVGMNATFVAPYVGTFGGNEYIYYNKNVLIYGPYASDVINGELHWNGRTYSMGSREPGAVSDNVFRAGDGVSQPSVIYKVDPEYSEEARKAKYGGTVMLAAIVDVDGHSRDIHVVKTLGMGLDEKAIEAVRQWKFKPGMKGGQPVNVRVTIEVNFRLLN
jgi:TonB family protein